MSNKHICVTLKPFNSMHHFSQESITSNQLIKGLKVKHCIVDKQSRKSKLSTLKKVFLT